MKLAIFAFSAALAFTPAALFAQTNIHDRKQPTSDRIGQGVKRGQLTARETGRLEHQEAGINREDARHARPA